MKIRNTITQWGQSAIVVAILVGYMVFLSLLGLRSFGLLQELELVVYDSLLWIRSIGTAIDNRIVLILANDEDQRHWGWPLPDEVLTRLFSQILVQQPRVIGLDLYRDLPVPLEKGQSYEQLSQLFKENQNIYGIFKYRDQKGARVNPPPMLAETHRVGFNDIPTDKGGIIRRGLLYMGDDEGNVHEAFSLKLVLHYLAQQGIQPQADPNDSQAFILGQDVFSPINPDFGGYTDQDTGGFQFMLDYPGAPASFPTLNLIQIFHANEATLQRLKDKIVIIGVNAEATPDFVYTPFGSWLRGDQRISGAVAQAYMTSQLLRVALGESHLLHTWSETHEILWIGLWSLAGTLICLWARSLWRFSLSTFAGIILLCFFGYFAFIHDVWIPVATPIVGWTTSFLLMLAHLSNQDKQQRAILMQIFSKHVSKEVAHAIWKEREHYLSKGRLVSRRITATVLFTDLQGFTSISEHLEPQNLVDWLNQYMETMVSLIEKQYNGQVNKFMGDAIMAVFGVPIPSTTPRNIAQDAFNAVKCALAMRDEMQQLCNSWENQGLPTIRMRVGIFTGPLVVGSVGSIERQEYTVIGDTVNIASRLESFDKTLDAENICRILIGESTLKYVADHFQNLADHIQTLPVGEVHLRGKQTPLTIYRVVGNQPPQGG